LDAVSGPSISLRLSQRGGDLMRPDDSVEALFDPGSADDFFQSAALGSFEPSATGEHNAGNALWLAEFCRLSYRNDRPGFASRESFIAGRGWREKRFFDTNGTQGGLYVNDGIHRAVLAFRGTSQLTDALVDGLAVLMPWEGPGRVHAGFHAALGHVWAEVRAALLDTPQPVFFAGHSLGAALAILSAARCIQDPAMRRPAALYTIGAPRVGNADFVATLRGVHHSRIVNDADIVPTVPPVLPLLPARAVYQHGGELHHIRHDGRIEVGPPDIEERATLGDLAAARLLLEGTRSNLKTVLDGAWRGALPENLSDHAPLNYAYRLERALLATA
jgi:hypothetical protein